VVIAGDIPVQWIAVQVSRTRPRLRIIVLSVQPEIESAALAVGADAFISKVDPPAQVVKTIAQVLANGSLPS
jgi:DNA-binding NarL/FixJ family response regulator